LLVYIHIKEMYFQFYKVRGISLVIGKLLTSNQGLYSRELNSLKTSFFIPDVYK
jgi:hypothetical protein